MANLSQIPNQQPQNLNNGKSERPSKIQLLRLANSERKIGESTEEQVKSVLKYVFVLLGLNEKDVPDDFEKNVLLNFIFNNYGVKYSCMDIRNAFEMAIAGYYPIEKELYGRRFSPLYLSKFMEAYSAYKSEMLRYFNKDEQPKLKELPQSAKDERSQEQKEEAIYKVILNYIVEYQKIPPIYDINSCFNTLVRKGLIVPTEEQNEIKKHNAIQLMQVELSKRFFSMGTTERYNTLAEFKKPENLGNEIKRHYLLDYWAGLLSVGQQKIEQPQPE